MTHLRVVIVDDEAPARERLARLLGMHAGVTIAGEAADVESAAELCRRESPQVVFLDVELRAQSGFELLPLLIAETAIVVVSAYQKYAGDAAAASALDFLLKPIHPDRLAKALANAALRFARPASTH